MRALLAVLLIAGSSSAFSADDKGFTYKGLGVGDPVEAVRERLPTYECSGSTCDYSMRLCVGKIGREACDASASFGGAWVNNGIIRLHEGRVAKITLLFTQSMVAAAAEASAQAYGPPASDKVEDLQTRAGVKVQSWRKSWRSGGQSLNIVQRSGEVETGAVMIESDEASAAMDGERKARAVKGSKDF